VMGLKTAVAHLKRVRKGETLSYGRTFAAERDSVIASIPIGYHDGYFRRLSNKGRAIVRGHYAPIVGRISMDWTLLDVTDVAEVTLDDEVVLIGRQSNAGILAEDVAAWAGTISYEVTCSVDRRVPRIFLPE
jgi:alanine racemase